ncbi:uncharacterized protein LOC142358769 isoform X2 [Convolutriloba macropyga]|uniref:uncharacterized protein LOC142358769 isoform X2 n=1 Tax=Convolutriloba macropyga TaxID=536237 RepID=UPI003F526B2E
MSSESFYPNTVSLIKRQKRLWFVIISCLFGICFLSKEYIKNREEKSFRLFTNSNVLLYSKDQQLDINYNFTSGTAILPNYSDNPLNHSMFHIITRVLSNDLPPLHGNNQTFHNTMLILDHEHLPKDFKRFWILNSIANKTKAMQLRWLLQSRNEAFESIDLPNTSSVYWLRKNALNINKARNLGIRRSFEMGATWVFIFDGCAFLTNQSFNSISNFVRNQSRPEFIHFNPMVRLQHKVNVSNNLTYENLFPYISGQQECQVAVHRKFVNLRSKISLMKSQKGLLFDEKRPYAKENKLHFLSDAKRHLSDQQVHCRKAMIGYSKKKSKTFESDMKLMDECGYVLRLLYHPEANAPDSQYLPAGKRGYRRLTSKRNFERLLYVVAKQNRRSASKRSE